jgi:hypothetical protein
MSNPPAFNEQVIIGGRTIGAENYVTLSQALILGAYMIRTNQAFTIASEDFEELVRYDGQGQMHGRDLYLTELDAAYDTVKMIVDSTYQLAFEAGRQG